MSDKAETTSPESASSENPEVTPNAEVSSDAAPETPATTESSEESSAQPSTEDAPTTEEESPAAEAPDEAAPSDAADAAPTEAAPTEEPSEEAASPEGATVQQDSVKEEPAREEVAPAEVDVASEESTPPVAVSEGEASAEVAATPAVAVGETPKGDEATEAAEATAPAEGEAAGAPTAEGGVAEGETAPAAVDDPEMLVLKAALADGSTVEGRVIGWNKGGYHVALGRIAAFCPVSQIEIGKPKNPKKYIDRTYKFHVSEIAPDGKRVVVSRASAIKQERKERTARIKERLQPGTKHRGRVTTITDFGAFVNLGDGAEGLVHVSEISRTRVDKPSEVLTPGQEVDVEVLKLEKGGQRISLSMKRLQPDPWKGVAERFPRGSKFKGKIARKADFGLFVEVEPGLEGLVHVSRLSLGLSVQDDSLVPGKEIEGWVHEVEGKRRRLSLSMREVSETDPWKDVEEELVPGSVVEGTVEKVAKFGVFVELKPGLTGLLPFSVVNLPAEANPKKKFPAGKAVKVTILDIDKKRKRISLGSEGSQAEGTPADFRQYMKDQQKGGGFGALAAALSKFQED